MSSNQNITLPAYLLMHLEKVAKQEGFIDYKFERDAGSNHGDGFMAVMLRITIFGNRLINNQVKEDKLSLICKLLPNSEIRQQQFSSKMLFKREAYFYNTVLPILVEFQKEKGLNVGNGFFSFPKCYIATHDSDDTQCAIIMDDLKVNGYELWTDKTKTLNIENVKLLIVALGRLHAISFALRDQRPDVFHELKNNLSDVLLKMIQMKVQIEIFSAAIELAVVTLESPRDLAIIRRIREQWTDVWRDCLSENVAEPFGVIGHADCWNNNLMFRSENGCAQQVCILDWQMCRMGSPALDLAYFLLSSTDKPLRDEHYEDLINLYYNTLSETVQLCGSDPEKLFTFNELQNQLKKFAKFGLTFASLLIQFMVSDGSKIVDMDDYAADVQRNGANSKYIVTFDDKSRLEFISRMSGVIEDAIKFGWYDEF